MVRRYLFTLLLLCVATVVAQAGITGNLTGRVVDKNKKGVAGATIRVMGTTKGANAKADGKYNIVGITAGALTIRVTAVGYDTITQTLTLVADQTRELNFTMNEGGTTAADVVVTADKEIIRSTDQGSERVLSGKQLTSIARTNVAAAISLQAGIVASGNNFQVRGGRTDETQVQVDGLTVTDQFTGGLGNSGSTVSAAMPSPFALAQVQAKTGGFGAEYGNATAGIVNSVVKTGSTDKFTGLVNWRKDVPFLFGSAGNGIQAGAPLEDVADVTLDGPLGLGQSTFSLAVRNTFQNHRNIGLQVLDPVGNNLGMMPNNRTWSRNLLGRVKFEIVNNLSLLVGGMYGMLSGERNGWDWMYANDQGMVVSPDGSPILLNGQPQLNGVPERNAKQIVVQEFSSNAFAQINHTLGASTIYDLRFSFNGKTTETGKRKTFGAPDIISGFDLWYPEDNLEQLNDSVFIPGQDKKLDVYDVVRSSGVTEDGFVKIETSKINPLTGYVEGSEDLQATTNPYGLFNYFVAHGNEGGVDFRNARYFQFDGNLSHGIEVGETRHTFKTGFELRLLRLTRHYNASPWNGSPFYDVFGADYGGNLYFDVTDQQSLNAKLLSEEPYSPVTGSVYVQDQIMFKGLVFTPGLRVDYLDARATYRTEFNPFVSFGADSTFLKTGAKLYLSPRISVTYPVSESGRQNINLSYGIYYQAPPFASFYDGFNAYALLQTRALGNPNLEMQRTNQYQVAYNHQLTDDLAFTITGYYRDIYNQSSLAYVAVTPVPYQQRVLSDYGSARGIEVTFQKRTTDHWGLNLNYALASAKGTANDDGFVPPIDPVTSLPAYPVTEFPLNFDRRHRINCILNFEWGNDEGPAIGGISFLEYFSINLTGFWQSGLPYTPSSGGGLAIGNVNSARYPSNWNTELRVLRTIPLDGILGGSAAVDVYLDANNLFNYTGAVAFYPRTGSADYDGTTLNRVPGDFPSTTYFKTADPVNKVTIAATQYDRVGKRLYNERADYNKDGKVTPEESYRGYQAYVQDAVSRRANYQYPRQIFFGVTFRF